MGSVPAETWPAEAFPATVRIDCGPCNHEKLATIEDEAILDYIAPMPSSSSAAAHASAPSGTTHTRPTSNPTSSIVGITARVSDSSQT